MNQLSTDQLNAAIQDHGASRRTRNLKLAVVFGVVTVPAIVFGLSYWQGNRQVAGAAVGISSEDRSDQPPMHWVVAQTGSADFQSLSEAVGASPPGSTIEVTDSAVYVDSVDVAGINNGLTISATGQPPAMLRPRAPDTAIITIHDADAITIQGFRMEVVHSHAILVYGNCSEIAIEGLHLTQSAIGSASAVVNVDRSSTLSGLRIRNCRFDIRGHGQALWLGESERPADKVIFEDNVVQAEYTHVAIMRPVRESSIRRTIFIGGHNGINLKMNESPTSYPPTDCLQISNNTMLDTTYWLGIHGTTYPLPRYATVHNNLLIDCGRIQGSTDEIAKAIEAWDIEANFWVPQAVSSSDQERVRKLDARVATQLTTIELVSRDPADPSFAVPLETAGWLEAVKPADGADHVGARPPKKQKEQNFSGD